MMNKLPRRIAILTVVLGCIVGILIPVHMTLFPDNGGYTRTVIFAHASEDLPGYYIIIDKITTPTSWVPIELNFHGYGELNITDQQAIWSLNTISLNLMVISPAVSISKALGKVYLHSNQYDTLEYVKITPLQPGPCTVITVLFPNNGSYTPLVCQQKTTDLGVGVNIGNQDRLLVNYVSGKPFVYENITTDAEILFVRQNAIAEEGIEYFILHRGSYCTIAGHSIYQTDRIGTKAFLNGTGIISENLNRHILPTEFSTPLTQNIGNLEHPYLFVNKSQLLTLRARCNGTIPGPWQEWYARLNSSAQWLLDQPAAKFTGSDCATVAFASMVDQNPLYLAKTREVLMTLDLRQNSYRQLINRGDDIVDFALAFDCIYNDLASDDQRIISNMLEQLTQPLFDDMYLTSLNNWRPVMSGGLGLAGLVLNNTAFVARAQEAVDFYLNECIRSNGACFEGQSYLRFAWNNALKFGLALRNLGGYDYLKSPRMIASLNFSIYAAGPDGSPPFYEDCSNSSLAREAMWICGLVSDPIFGSNLK
jgi:hypothetical protein